MNTRPFDLEAAKRGEAICTAAGTALRFVECSPENPIYPVLCVHPDGRFDTYTTGGVRYNFAPDSGLNLCMVVKTKTVWVNLYLNSEGNVTTHGVAFGTEEAAASFNKECILRTVSVEIPS